MDIDKANVAVTGAPGVIRLGGVTYLVGQPDDRVFATILTHLRGLAKSPLQAIADDLQYLSPEDRAAAIKAAVELKSGGGVQVTESFTSEYLYTPDGAALLTWLLIRKEQPDVKLETVRAGITDANVIEVLASLMTEGGLEAVVAGKLGRRGSSNGAGTAAPPTTAGSCASPKAG